MPLSLTPDRKEEVFLLVKRAFSDFRYFDELVTEPLRKFIDDSTKFDIDFQITKSIAERYLNIHSFVTKDQKEVLEKIRVILTAAAVYLCYLSCPSHVKIISTIDELFEDYPSFAEQLNVNDPIDKKELDYLVKFRNFMVIGITLVQAKGNKLFLLRVVERLEGSNNEYITGTGQKPTVNRRVAIFHQESEVTIVKKAGKRKKSPEEVEQELKVKEEKKQLKQKKQKLDAIPSPFDLSKTIIAGTSAITTTSFSQKIPQSEIPKPQLPQHQSSITTTTTTEITQGTMAGMINFEKLFSDKDPYDPAFDPAELLLGEPYAVSLTEELFGKNNKSLKGNC
jgi:hypothetical protein